MAVSRARGLSIQNAERSRTANRWARPLGGVITEGGGYRIHTFNNTDQFITYSPLNNLSILIVAGGGGGGGSYGGGGGAGGLLYFTGLSIVAQQAPITVGLMRIASLYQRLLLVP